MKENQNMTDLTVNIKQTIHAPIQKVFDAWLNPEMLSKFILPMPGMPEPQVQNDTHEGGSFSILMQVGDNKIPHTGKYLEISSPHKLVFSWVSPFSVDGSTVTLLFSKAGDSATKVELTHVRFIDAEHRDNHEAGWGHILDSLNELLS